MISLEKFSPIKDGRLTPVSDKLFGAIGVCAALSLYFFFDSLDGAWYWIVASIAVVFGYGSAWAALMHKWGYKPFTNDPLGWRKAKATYQDGESSPASKPGFIARLFGRK